MSGLLEPLPDRSGELPSPDDRICGEADRPTKGRKGPAVAPAVMSERFHDFLYFNVVCRKARFTRPEIPPNQVTS